MKTVSLEEFQKLVGISDKALVWLLTQNLLQCQTTADRGLCVDLESVDTENLRKAILARRDSVLEERKDIIVERLGNAVRDELQSIVDEAIGHYIAEGSKE
ncbi:MAG: hypothetical protein J0M12_15800 [Deltaproteobacteria bacterium]|nr:hypothetical protein [Deltaproteobacteria bacterium]